MLRSSGCVEGGCIAPSLLPGCTPDSSGMLQVCCCVGLVPAAGLVFLCSSGHFMSVSTQATLQCIGAADAKDFMLAGAYLIYVQLAEEWMCRAVIRPPGETAWVGRFLCNTGFVRHGRAPAALPLLPAQAAAKILSGACCRRCPLVPTHRRIVGGGTSQEDHQPRPQVGARVLVLKKRWLQLTYSRAKRLWRYVGKVLGKGTLGWQLGPRSTRGHASAARSVSRSQSFSKCPKSIGSNVNPCRTRRRMRFPSTQYASYQHQWGFTRSGERSAGPRFDTAEQSFRRRARKHQKP